MSCDDELVSAGLTDADDPRRGLEPLDQPMRQRTRDERATASTRQHARERIQIVARHDRAVGRQRVHQIRVAVIDDVKDVELVAARGEPAWIVPDTVDDPIGGLCEARRAPNGSRVNRRTIAGRSSVGSTTRRSGRLEVEEQHLGDEIHAVPSLLAQIGHDGDAWKAHATSSWVRGG